MMKKTLISALALTAILGTSLSATARGGDGEGRMGGARGMGGEIALNFDAIDTDGNGALSTAEMEAFKKGRFDAADTNGDGALSSEEMTAQHEARQAERAAQRQAKMIEEHDKDGNGTLSFDEMGSDRSAKMFEHLDADDNGEISKEELEKAKERFAGRRGGHGDKGGHSEGRGHGKWMQRN
ncbi:MAG: Ca2+-binding EF-hand superfamily protein [Halocynthiibacter sp.]|jgi:Ca2+-binding EF-hand superfamily protein